jgi:hypothetical protein
MASQKVERAGKKLRWKGSGRKDGTGDFSSIHWHKMDIVLEEN